MKKNLILLAMSTLALKNLTAEDYKPTDYTPADDSEAIMGCVSQLEPVVRYFLRICGEGSDMSVLALCTKETLRRSIDREILEKYLKVDLSAFPEERKEQLLDPGLNQPKCSAYDFFRLRILASPESAGKKITFIKTDLNEEMPEEALAEAVRHIIVLKERDELGRFFIDTHGGFRDVSLVMNAITSLLRHQDIEPEMVCGTNVGLNRITDQKNAFDIFEFVAGMEDFTHFGRVDVLEHYFEKKETTPQVRRLLEAMRRVAEGTQFCNPRLYKAGLKDLGQAFHGPETAEDDSGREKEQPYQEARDVILLGIFRDYIRADYGRLLEEESQTNLNIIERCIDKKLYQQALTFIEANMPEEFAHLRFFYYTCKKEDEAKLERIKGKPGYKPAKDFIFDNYIQNAINIPPGAGDNQYLSLWVEKLAQKAKDCLEAGKASDLHVWPEGILKEIKAVMKERPEFSSADLNGVTINGSVKSKGMRFPLEKTYYIEEDRESKRTGAIETGCSSEVKVTLHTDVDLTDMRKKNNLAAVFLIHHLLRNWRNKFNHGDGEARPAIESLAMVMKLYIALIRDLEPED